MLDRLEHEVSFCAKEVRGILPSELKPKKKKQTPPASQQVAGEQSGDQSQLSEDVALVCYEQAPMETSSDDLNSTLRPTESSQLMEEGEEMDGGALMDEGGGRVGGAMVEERREGVSDGGCVCMPERAALIKSILNFLKKAIPEPTLAENIRTCACLCRHTLEEVAHASFSWLCVPIDV